MTLHQPKSRPAIVLALSIAFLSPLAMQTPFVQTAGAAELKIASLSGNWRGKGKVKTSIKSKKENIRCRLTNRPVKNKSKMSILGTCSVGNFLLPVNGWIQKKGKKNSYTASLFNSLTRLSSNYFSGRISGKKLKLNYNGVDNITKQPIKASITIIGSGSDNFHLEIKRADPKTNKQFKVGTIKFKKH
ncbi:MAG: hypothetical protein JKX93_18620 [Rhizobiaceae bacterium]|nr:hypothetical protein [Rhizobiaceae bacterium]